MTHLITCDRDGCTRRIAWNKLGLGPKDVGIGKEDWISVQTSMSVGSSPPSDYCSERCMVEATLGLLDVHHDDIEAALGGIDAAAPQVSSSDPADAEVEPGPLRVTCLTCGPKDFPPGQAEEAITWLVRHATQVTAREHAISASVWQP